MFRGLYTYFFGEKEAILSLDEASNILNNATGDKKQEAQETIITNNMAEENITFHKIGIITRKNGNNYTIDDLYTYESSELTASEGSSVSYISYVSDRKLYLTNVSVINNNDWDLTPINVKGNWYYRILTVQVVKKNLRDIITEPGTLKISLNQVHSEFVPIVGDWLQVEAKCVIDENISDLTGTVLEVTKIKPLRLKQTIGLVKYWDENHEIGQIDKNIFFNLNSLSSGYLPYIGDKVIVEAIESEQKLCDWRAIKVLPYCVHNVSKDFETVQNEPLFISDVKGIEITNDVVLTFEKPQENQIFNIIICNKSHQHVTLKEIEFWNKNGQCKLQNVYKDFVIESNNVLNVICKCTSRNYGQNKELLLFTFENNCIVGRYITILLKSPMQSSSNCRNFRSNLTIKEQQYRNCRNLNGSRNYIPGQKTTNTPAFIARRIAQYKIPDKLWNLYFDFFSDPAILSEMLLQRKPCLHKLDYQCYEDYFHTLLHLEEMEHVLAMRKYDQEKVCFITNGEYLMLEIENLAEKRPSIVQGDKIIATDPFNCNSNEYEGIVHKVGARHVFLKFSPMFHENYKGEDYSIRVIASRNQIKRYHHAIGLAVKNLGRELLFPNKFQMKAAQFKFCPETIPRNKAIANKLREIINQDKTESILALQRNNSNPDINERRKKIVKIEWYDKKLNFFQKEAIRNILLAEAKPLPYLIFGPPGTGKTVTLVETILQVLTLLPDARVLVATPSNSAADTIATRLIDSGVLKPGDLIRFVAYKYASDDLIPLKLIPYCATADITAEGTDHTKKHTTLKNGLTLGVSCSVIGRHRVTISTCSNLGNLFNMRFPKGHFTHIILDEAGHLLEPEAMIPLSFLDLSSGQAVLAGDPLQLGPVVLSKIAMEYGLGESYLERLMNRFPYSRDPEGFPKTAGYNPKLVTKLVYNYRSLPDILSIPSKLFYNSELIPTIEAVNSDEFRLLKHLKEILPNFKNKSLSSIIFHGVEGENCQTPDSPSWFNPTEASQVFMYVNDLYRLGLKSEDIGIISPYVKQIQQIRSILIEAEFAIPKIGTVEEFQGQEFKVVILSVVRSFEHFLKNDVQHNLGFIFCPRRLNVAITRAQVLLIIIGNPNLLIHDPHWRSVLNYCVERGAYCGCIFNI